MGASFKNSDNRLLEFFKRETGFSTPRVYSRRVSASQDLIKQIGLYGELSGHRGCVNTIEFNSTGEVLVSGSDDRQVKLWDWARQKLKFSYRSGHLDNIFQARIMPFTDDRIIVTSAADCQVRLGQVLENGSVETKRLSRHEGRVHKLAVEPGSPYVFYSCSEDSIVQHYDLRSNSASKLFYCSSNPEIWPASSIGLNSITIDPRNPNYLAAGGSDMFARVYDIRKCHINASSKAGIPAEFYWPRHLSGNSEEVHITALAYSNMGELLVSYNEELIYLFQRDMATAGSSHQVLPSEDTDTKADPQVYSGHRNVQTVKGVGFFGLNDEYVLSGSDCGHIFIWKKKGGELIRMIVGDRDIVNQLEPHPTIPVLASCGIEKTIKLWTPSSDVVKPLPDCAKEIMEQNKLDHEELSRVRLPSDLVMHVLHLRRSQTRAYNERRGDGPHFDSSDEDLGYDDDDDDDDDGDDGDDGDNNDNNDDDNNDGGAYYLGFTGGLPSDEGGNSRDCNIS